jgi:pimeloyl-ACP methyl ester carboxylesterase
MTTLTSADGTEIAYEIAGSGPPVVLVDGAMCFRDSGPMRSIADALTGRLSIGLYDRRGRGASGDTSPYSTDREIDDLAALIGALGGAAGLFGISSGGALALHAAAALGPATVTRVGVYEVPFVPEPMRAGAAGYTQELTTALAAGDREKALRLFFSRVGMPEEAIEGMSRSPFWPVSLAIAPTLAYDDEAMGDSAVPIDLVRRLRVPVLGLAGAASPDFLQFGARGVAEAAADGRFELIAGQTHAIEADAVAPHLTSFFGA